MFYYNGANRSYLMPEPPLEPRDCWENRQKGSSLEDDLVLVGFEQEEDEKEELS